VEGTFLEEMEVWKECAWRKCKCEKNVLGGDVSAKRMLLEEMSS
jgi:hypothetical protein